MDKLIRSKAVIFRPPPTKIVVFYKQYQERYGTWELTASPYGSVKCVQGLPTESMFVRSSEASAPLLSAADSIGGVDGGMMRETEEAGEERLIIPGTFIILDDFMDETLDNALLSTLYTAGRHMGLSGILTV